MSLGENLKSTGSEVSSESSLKELQSVFKSELEVSLILKVEPVLESLNYELRDLEVLGIGAQTIIRITLDKEAVKEADEEATKFTYSRPERIGIEDCHKVHQLLNPMFDVWDPLAHAYSLEIASPGEKPSLRTRVHFEEAMGQKIQFQTREPMEMPEPMKPRRNWEGTLEALSTEGVVSLKDGYGLHQIPLTKIKSAQWMREWTLSSDKPGKSGQDPRQSNQKSKKKKSK